MTSDRDWVRVDRELPDNGIDVETKIHDEHGIRNQVALRRSGNLWFFTDGTMYVYYVPTHWRALP